MKDTRFDSQLMGMTYTGTTALGCLHSVEIGLHAK